MAYRNKVYVAFDGDRDMKYYNLFSAWNNNENFDFKFYNAHDLASSKDSSKEESIKHSLRERFYNSKLFILLIGDHTKLLTKFVKWEIETAIRLELPIICINLNNSKTSDNLKPHSLDDYPCIFVPYQEKIINHAMKNWPDQFKKHKINGDHSDFYYPDKVYNDLGL